MGSNPRATRANKTNKIMMLSAQNDDQNEILYSSKFNEDSQRIIGNISIQSLEKNKDSEF